MTDDRAEQTFREVMAQDPAIPATPFQSALRDFVFGDVWSRPGLSRRDRRWVTLTCVAAADAPDPIDEQVYAALASGDLELDALLEFVLHFAVYCGWPKASHLEGAIARQWARLHSERGQPTPPWPELTPDSLGPWAESSAKILFNLADDAGDRGDHVLAAVSLVRLDNLPRTGCDSRRTIPSCSSRAKALTALAGRPAPDAPGQPRTGRVTEPEAPGCRPTSWSSPMAISKDHAMAVLYGDTTPSTSGNVLQYPGGNNPARPSQALSWRTSTPAPPAGLGGIYRG